MLRQARAVAIDEEKHNNDLRAAGWIWDSVCRYWRHPERPGEEIWPG
jgi:hypothetical protein